jgi:hypothetical protein
MGKGIGGHQSAAAGTTTWLTPKFVLDALGEFDLDPCAAPAPRPFPTAKTHYVEREGDGWKRRWFGRVWLNPPYGQEAGRWLLRLAGHGVGTALIFARTETEDFFAGVWERADAALFLRGRLTFLHPDGTEADSNGGAPSVLVAYGAEDAERLHSCGLEGQFVPIAPPAFVFMAQAALRHAVEECAITWRGLLRAVLEREGRALTLPEIYSLIRRHPKGNDNQNVEAKVRQTLNRGGFVRVATGQYALPL